MKYRDTGCPDGLYPSCKECPLPECRYEGNTKSKAGRDERIVELVKSGMRHGEVGKLFGITRSAVRHVWNNRKEKK